MTKKIEFLPHQMEIIKDTNHRIIALVGGYGSGKSYLMCRKAVMLMLANPGFDGAMLEPTYSLITEILLPEMHKALEQFGVNYTYKAGEGIFYCDVWDPIDREFKTTRIITKSMENYERLIGLNLAWVCADEIDTSRASLGYSAYIKLLGRIRAGRVRQFCMFSTPEGFKTLYRIFVEEGDKSKRLVKARSTDNPFLPQDFIDSMREQYSAELIDSYINGEFTNLTSGTVYNNYERNQNNTSKADDGLQDLLIGIDFNISNMAAVVGIQSDGNIYIIDEFSGYEDTPALIEAIKEKYSDRTIIAFPDASGKNRSTTDGSVTNHKLLRAAGFRIRVNTINPNVQDRINTVNARLLSSDNDVRLFINLATCPNLVKGLEQQAYDDKGKPDKTRNIDHQLDALGYLVQKVLPIQIRETKHNRKRNEHVYKPHINE